MPRAKQSRRSSSPDSSILVTVMNTDFSDKLKIILTALTLGLVGFFACVLILQPWFSGSKILDQQLILGPLQIQYYGIIIGVAVLSAYALISHRRIKFTIDENDSDIILFIVLLSGLIGARVYHVISEFNLYAENILQIFAVWNGGLSIFGAALGGLLGLWLYQRKTKKYSLPILLDWITPGLVLGQIIGRFGNFVNYELYGSATNLPWKMFVPEYFRLPQVALESYFHPLFLYEAMGSVIILVLLLRLRWQTGRLFLAWLLLYNGMRFFLEFIRVDSVIYGGIRINAVISLILVSVAIYCWYRIKVQSNLSSNT